LKALIAQGRNNRLSTKVQHILIRTKAPLVESVRITAEVSLVVFPTLKGLVHRIDEGG
jgi:hypothetical protein